MLTGTGDPDQWPVGEQVEFAGHDLEVIEGHLPCNDHVWECRDCEKRRTHAHRFTEYECSGGEPA